MPAISCTYTISRAGFRMRVAGDVLSRGIRLEHLKNFACEASRKSAANQSLCKRDRPLLLLRESRDASLFFCASLGLSRQQERRRMGEACELGEK
jgi:hypothetical protein